MSFKSNSKKCIHITAVSGGVSVYLSILTKYINSERFNNVVICEKNEGNNFSDDTKIYRINLVRNISLVKDVLSIYRIVKIIRKEKPDIIHLHSAKAGILGRVAGVFTRAKIVYTPHAFSYLSTNNYIKKRSYLFLEKIFKLTGNYVLATSKSEAERAIKDVGYLEKKVIVFNNSIEDVEEAPSDFSDLNLELPDYYICSVGRPSYQKNIYAMLDAFKILKKDFPELKFLLLGVGHYSPDKDRVKGLIKKLNLESDFIMIPWLEREQIFEIVKNAKLYISTSRYEGLPYSVIEALALGKACVLSDCDGNRDLVAEGVNGYLIPIDNLREGIAEKCKFLLSYDDVREKFEQNSKNLFHQNYLISKNINLLEKIYSDLSC